MKRFAFPISHGKDTQTLIGTGYGVDRVSAMEYLKKSLASNWYVIEDVSEIQEFINEARLPDDEPLPQHPHLLKQFQQFDEDLDELQEFVDQAKK